MYILLSAFRPFIVLFLFAVGWKKKIPAHCPWYVLYIAYIIHIFVLYSVTENSREKKCL